MSATAGPAKRARLYARDGWRCAYCGTSGRDRPARLSLDHIVPRSKGGTCAASNLVTSCLDCNQQRRDRPIVAWLRLVSLEVVEHAVATVARALEGGNVGLRERVLEVGRARGPAARAMARSG